MKTTFIPALLGAAAAGWCCACPAPAAAATNGAAPPAGETPAQRDARLAWWREAKFGMFIHWGLYAIPAGTYHGKQYTRKLGEWIMHDARIPVAEYEAYAREFNPVKFNADAWVGLAKAAGMKYLVITAKHCDGFAMYASRVSPYNIVAATPFKRDPLAELGRACAAAGVRFGFYYSHCWDWHEPNATGLINDWDFGPKQQRHPDEYFRQKALPQVEELAARYQPAVFWFDVPDLPRERSQEFLQAVRRHVPACIVNDRVGNGLGDYETPEQYIPKAGPPRDWETCMTINDTWGYKSYDDHWKSAATLIRNLIDIASKGGNYLLNVGPTAAGEIPPPCVERLQQMGAWLRVNGAAIYGTRASPFGKLPFDGRCTRQPGCLYLHVFTRPADGRLVLPLANRIAKASLLAGRQALKLEGPAIILPDPLPDPVATVVAVEIAGEPEVLPPAAPSEVKP